MNRTRILFITSGLFLLFLLACAPSSKSSAGQPGPTTVKMVMETPRGFAGKTLMISGRFAGWKGGCLTPPPVSRSDWMLVQEDACMYVHGPVPRGLDPLRPRDEPVDVQGVLRLDHKGVPYLEASARR